MTMTGPDLAAIRLFSSDLRQLSGATPKLLEKWIEIGVLRPQNAFQGHGVARLFTFEDAVAVATGMAYRAMGADTGRVEGIVKFLAEMPVDKLRQNLAEGLVVPIPGHTFGADWFPGMLVKYDELGPLPPRIAAALRGPLDLPTILRETEQKVRKLIVRREKDEAAGRNRRGRPRKNDKN